jgi:hypothetical protein
VTNPTHYQFVDYSGGVLDASKATASVAYGRQHRLTQPSRMLFGPKLPGML